MGKELLNIDQQLLLKDLCCRLPYRVKVSTYSLIGSKRVDVIETLYAIDKYNWTWETEEDDWMRPIGKPYLFPLSSMTEEQKKEYDSIVFRIDIYSFEELQGFYLKNHFDYHHLIERNLAIDATNLGIYKKAAD